MASGASPYATARDRGCCFGVIVGAREYSLYRLGWDVQARCWERLVGVGNEPSETITDFVNGRCDLYNIALASGVMIAVAYGASCTFDVIDLRRNRFPPRVTRPY